MDPFYFVDYVPDDFKLYSYSGPGIVELYSVNVEESIHYVRIVENVFDWIGKIAGIPNLLYIILRLLTIQYQSFNSNMQIARKLKFLDEQNFG